MKLLQTILVLTLFMFGIVATAQDPHTDSGLKKVIVQEVIQVSSYTYLNVLEDGEKKWIAVPTIEANIGEVYYYKGGVEMPNFQSMELSRTFDSVLFLGAITNANAVDPVDGIVEPNATKEETNPGKQPTRDRLELNIEAIDGGIRIANLFENPQDYAGKSIKVVGEVTKFTPSIMGKNWVHFFCALDTTLCLLINHSVTRTCTPQRRETVPPDFLFRSGFGTFSSIGSRSTPAPEKHVAKRRSACEHLGNKGKLGCFTLNTQTPCPDRGAVPVNPGCIWSFLLRVPDSSSS